MFKDISQCCHTSRKMGLYLIPNLIFIIWIRGDMYNTLHICIYIYIFCIVMNGLLKYEVLFLLSSQMTLFLFFISKALFLVFNLWAIISCSTKASRIFLERTLFRWISMHFLNQCFGGLARDEKKSKLKHWFLDKSGNNLLRFEQFL